MVILSWHADRPWIIMECGQQPCWIISLGTTSGLYCCYNRDLGLSFRDESLEAAMQRGVEANFLKSF